MKKKYIKLLFIISLFSINLSYTFTPVDSCNAGQVALVPSNSNPVVAGLATIAEINYVLCSRYVTANGDSDTGFGDEGVAITTHGTSAQASALAIQTSNDKIVVAGSATVSGTENFCVMRYDTDGTLDSTFGTSGIATTVIGDHAEARAVALQSDEKIIAAGLTITNGQPSIALARYATNGTLDATFGTGGIVTTSISYRAFGASVAIQSDGKIIVVGNVDDREFGVVRYNTNGTLDGTFGTGGIVQTSLSGHTYATSVGIQTDDKIVVVGKSGSTFTVVRYDSTGATDNTFGTSGVAQTAFNGYAVPTSLIIQTDGKIVVGGTNDGTLKIVRYNANGTLDTGFGTSGIVSTLAGQETDALSLALQSDGKIMCATSTITGITLFRLETNGSLDETFGEDGLVTYPANVQIIREEITQLSDRKPLGTNGGNATGGIGGTWQTRTINNIRGYRGSVTVANNQFTLQPGQYSFFVEAPAYKVGSHLARLYNVTKSKVEAYGKNAYSKNYTESNSIIEVHLLLDIATTYEIQHKTETSRASDGFGIATGYGDAELYTTVQIKKIPSLG